MLDVSRTSATSSATSSSAASSVAADDATWELQRGCSKGGRIERREGRRAAAAATATAAGEVIPLTTDPLDRSRSASQDFHDEAQSVLAHIATLEARLGRLRGSVDAPAGGGGRSSADGDTYRQAAASPPTSPRAAGRDSQSPPPPPPPPATTAAASASAGSAVPLSSRPGSFGGATDEPRPPLGQTDTAPAAPTAAAAAGAALGAPAEPPREALLSSSSSSSSSLSLQQPPLPPVSLPLPRSINDRGACVEEMEVVKEEEATAAAVAAAEAAASRHHRTTPRGTRSRPDADSRQLPIPTTHRAAAKSRRPAPRGRAVEPLHHAINGVAQWMAARRVPPLAPLTGAAARGAANVRGQRPPHPQSADRAPAARKAAVATSAASARAARTASTAAAPAATASRARVRLAPAPRTALGSIPPARSTAPRTEYGGAGTGRRGEGRALSIDRRDEQPSDSVGCRSCGSSTSPHTARAACAAPPHPNPIGVRPPLLHAKSKLRQLQGHLRQLSSAQATASEQQRRQQQLLAAAVEAAQLLHGELQLHGASQPAGVADAKGGRLPLRAASHVDPLRGVDGGEGRGPHQAPMQHFLASPR